MREDRKLKEDHRSMTRGKKNHRKIKKNLYGGHWRIVRKNVTGMPEVSKIVDDRRDWMR